MKKENWFKKHYKFSWVLNLVFVIMISLVFLEFVSYLNYQEVSPFYEDDLLKQYSSNTYKTKAELNNITIGLKFNGLPSKAIIKIYDENLELVESDYTDNLTFSREGKYYGKITKIAKFTENNASETKYTWILFELSKDSENNLDFVVDYTPVVWKEEPTLKW